MNLLSCKKLIIIYKTYTLDMKNSKDNLFMSILELPSQGVYGIFNPINKKFIIHESKNIIQSVMINIDKIKSNKHSIPELSSEIEHLELKVLASCDDPILRGMLVNHYVNTYKLGGWVVYGKETQYRRFNVKTRYVLDGKGNIVGVALILYSYYKEYGPVGVFKTKKELEEFKAQYYSGNDFTLVMANNNETRQFIMNQSVL